MASFVAGAQKIAAKTEPRLLILTGESRRLRRKLLDEIKSRDCEIYEVMGDRFSPLVVSLPAAIPSKTKIVCIYKAELIESWDWIIPWLAKVKGIRIVLDTDNEVFAEKLGKKVNTRGLVVTCAVPNSSQAKEKLARMICSWYPAQSPSQVMYLLNKQDFNLDFCLDILDKFYWLRLPLDTETMELLNLEADCGLDFVVALQSNKTSFAMTKIGRVQSPETAVHRLSTWLDCLARVKVSQGFMKPAYEVSNEVGIPVKDVEYLQQQARKFDTVKINRAAIALANADRSLNRGRDPRVVLEMLTNSW